MRLLTNINYISIVLPFFVNYSVCVENPVIGILAQELLYDMADTYPHSKAYIAASYVKAVEASGARVVPIMINQTETYYRNVLQSINGLLLPGGQANCVVRNGGYCEIMNRMNDYFPVLGVCLGFEVLFIAANNGVDIQTRCNVQNTNLPLQFRSGYRRSRLYSDIPYSIVKILKYFDVTSNHHKWCTTQSNLTKFGLDKEWTVTSDSFDRSTRLTFVSSAEHMKYPIFSVQFHPEKAMYEWITNQNNPHSDIAIKANRYFYDILVKHSKLNAHSFPNSILEYSSLIYNYSPIASYNETGFMQIYLF